MLVLLMTAVTGAWADDWTDIIINGNLEGTDRQCFFVKENGLGSENVYYARIQDGIGKDGSRGIVLQSTGNEVNTWDTQFYLRLPYELPAGTKYRLTFDYKADVACACDLQSQNEPGEYIIWYIDNAQGSPACNFGTNWNTYNSGEITVPANCDGSQTTQEGLDFKNNFQTISFSLAKNQTATKFYIDNIKFEILSSDLSKLTKSPATKAWPQYPVEITSMAIMGDFLGQGAEGNWNMTNGWALTKDASNTKLWTLAKVFQAEAKTFQYKVFANGNMGDFTYPVAEDAKGQLVISEAGEYLLKVTVDTETGAVSVVADTKHTVKMKDGVQDATNWQGKAGEGEYQSLPLTGLEAGTAVSVKYNGTKKVKSVKAASTGVQDPIDLTSTDGGVTWTLTSSPAYDVELEVTYYTDAELAAREALETAIAIATNINPTGLAEAITAAQTALNAGDATAESMAQAAQTLEAAIKTYFGEVLPNLGAIVTALNEETLNTAYANAQAALADEDVTPQELAAAMQNIITAAQAVAPEHLQNLKGYAVKYGAGDAASLIDDALAAIEDGNVSQIITTMTAVKTAATPLAQQVLSTMIGYVQAFGLTEQATQAQAALDGGNYITMITTAKALFTHLVAAAQEYLPKLGAIAEGLNDETLNTAYADAVALLAKESITPEELAAAMQNIITAAQAVAPEHLQNLKGYAVKYGATDAATLVDNALAAIEAGNVAQIIATMTAVKEAATPLAQTVLGTMKNYVEAFGLTEQAAQAQAALEGGNYITMITTAKALFTHLIAAAKEYLPKLGAIAEGLNDETLNTAYADAVALLAKESITPEELGAAMQNIIVAAKAVAPEHLQNLKGYAVKYGATDAATLIDAALAAIEAGNVAQIIATMTAVKEAATPLAQTVLGTMKNYVEAFGLTEQAAQAQAALEGGNYITMITTAKALFTHLIAAAKEYLPKLGDIATGLNDETLNKAYTDAVALLAKESITPEELGAAMQNIIVAAKAVAPEHLQNLKGYAVKYGATDAATLIDDALAAIEAGNVAQIIATMTAVKEAATPLAQQVLSGITAYVQAFGLTEQAAQAQAALEGGNYITMITTAKALFTHLIAAAQEYLPKLADIATGLNDETLNTAYAAAQELLAKESITPEELGAAMQNIIVAAKAVAPEHLQNLRGYAVKYGQDGTATLVDNALAAIEAGNVAQIIATMTAVKEAATPLATSILTQMIEEAKNYEGLAEDVTAAQAVLAGGNYISMIITAKALYAKLTAISTGISTAKAAADKDVWYDMNGRKLQGKPTVKGVYMKNNMKVVVK